MATTPYFGWPYPEPQHVPDVPKWNGDLAKAIDNTVKGMGRVAMNTRHSDDVLGPGSWGHFCGTSMGCDAGALLIVAQAVWAGRNCSLQVLVNGGVFIGNIPRRNANLGRYTDTLAGVIYHAGGAVSADLKGAGDEGDNLLFGDGSCISICFLGRGA